MKRNDFTMFERNELGKRLLSPEILQRWSCKTLLERVALIQKEFNVKVSYYKLRVFYLKHGVKWRSTQKVYRTHLIMREGLEQQRVQYIKEILPVIMSEQPYVYFDEMALHSFLTR